MVAGLAILSHSGGGGARHERLDTGRVEQSRANADISGGYGPAHALGIAWFSRGPSGEIYDLVPG
jgi:hypothetical protein